MIQDIISVYSIICDLKEVAKKAKIGSPRKFPDTQYPLIVFLTLIKHNKYIM